jgi:hypothetical protein
VSWSGRLVTPLLIGALALPAGAAVAQDEGTIGWTTSWDGLALGTNDATDHLPTWRTVPPDEFPSVIADIPGPESLYRVGETVETGTRVTRLIDGSDLTWLDEGHTPVLATAIVDDDGATWARGQHIVSMPVDCPERAGECRVQELFLALADLAAPAGTPVSPISVGVPLQPGAVASTAVVDHDGTLFSFGGDGSVSTKVNVRDDGRVVVRAAARVGDDLGGRLRGYDAFVLDADDPRPEGLRQAIGGLVQRARTIRDAGIDPAGVNVRRFDCPPSGQGYAVGQYLFSGLGSNVGPAVDPALEGGATSLVTEIVFFDCRPDGADEPPLAVPEGPVAAFVCGSTGARHQPLLVEVDGRQLTFSSYLEQLFGVVTLGISPGVDADLHARVGGANGGEIFTVGLEGVQLDSAAHPDAVLWLGESQAGIDSYGPKPHRQLQLTVDGKTFNLVDQQRELMGDAFDVGPGEQPRTNCPGFDFSPDGAATIFADGFEPGDVSAWAYPNPD